MVLYVFDGNPTAPVALNLSSQPSFDSMTLKRQELHIIRHPVVIEFDPGVRDESM
jgi:hypothetical protein